MLKEILIRNSLISLVKAHENLKDYHLCLAVWFNKSGQNAELNKKPETPIVSTDEAYLLEVAPEFGFLKMVHAQADSYGLGHIKQLHHWMVSPEKLETILESKCAEITELKESLNRGENDYQVLYIDQSKLGHLGSKAFGQYLNLPENAIEAWYLSAVDFQQYQSTKGCPILNTRPGTAILLTDESSDFIHRKGLMFSKDTYTDHWRPNTSQGMVSFSWYQEWKSGNPGFFVLNGGRSYSILGFEIVSKPSISKAIRHSNADNMYVQVFLKVA